VCIHDALLVAMVDVRFSYVALGVNDCVVMNDTRLLAKSAAAEADPAEKLPVD